MLLRGGNHVGFFLTSVVLPFVFVLIMTGLESLIDDLKWRQRIMKVGWDICVLALGVIGGIFSNPDLMGVYGGTWALLVGLFAMAVSLGCAVGIAHLRRSHGNGTGHTAEVPGWKLFVSLAAAGAALGIPSYVAFAY